MLLVLKELNLKALLTTLVMSLLFIGGCSNKQSNAIESQNASQESYSFLLDKAKQGNNQAQHKLALMFQFGRGITRSPKQAAYWFDKAIRSTNADAMFDYYLFLLSKEGMVPEMTSKPKANDFFGSIATNKDYRKMRTGDRMIKFSALFGHPQAIRYWCNVAGNEKAPKKVRLTGVSICRYATNNFTGSKDIQTNQETYSQLHQKAMDTLGSQSEPMINHTLKSLKRERQAYIDNKGEIKNKSRFEPSMFSTTKSKPDVCKDLSGWEEKSVSYSNRNDYKRSMGVSTNFRGVEVKSDSKVTLYCKKGQLESCNKNKEWLEISDLYDILFEKEMKNKTIQSQAESVSFNNGKKRHTLCLTFKKS